MIRKSDSSFSFSLAAISCMAVTCRKQSTPVTPAATSVVNKTHTLPAALESYTGKPIHLDIRPEHVCIHEENSISLVPDCILKVMAYEKMGNEQLVYLSLGEQRLVVRRAARDSMDLGREKAIHFSVDKLIYIDAVSGNVLGLESY